MCVGKQLFNVCCGDCFATPPLEGRALRHKMAVAGSLKICQITIE